MVPSSPTQAELRRHRRAFVRDWLTEKNSPINMAWLRFTERIWQPKEMDVGSGKRPLAGKSFYFDAVGVSDRNAITLKLQKLGGVIDAFLSKDVTHIITSRPIPKTKREPSRQTRILNSVNVNSVSPASPSPICPVSTMLKSPWSVGSHNSEDTAKKSTTSRSEQLVVKALTRDTSGNTDVIQNAINWGVKIIRLETLTKLLDMEKKLCSDAEKPKQHALGTKILQPLLKFESCDRKYRPHYKHFDQWPAINVKGCGGTTSPFEPPPKQTRTADSPRPKNGVPRKQSNGVWKSTGYCEMCASSYKDLMQHLQSKEHIQFCGNKSNYRGLDETIAICSREFNR